METAVGMDKIKEALASMGLKQGGTPTQRRDRLWSTRGKSVGRLTRSSCFAKGGVERGPVDAIAKKKIRNAPRASPGAESLAQTLLEHLQQLEATRKRRAKATLSLAELEAEAEEDDDWVEEEAEGQEEGDYNPLKLPMPLGRETDPVLAETELHGLNLEFTCEICGNYSYWGRRAYERHFKEFKHQHGMRVA